MFAKAERAAEEIGAVAASGGRIDAFEQRAVGARMGTFPPGGVEPHDVAVRRAGGDRQAVLAPE